MVKVIFLEEFGKAFVPKRMRPTLRLYLLKAGIQAVPYKLFGGMFYGTAVITGILYMLVLYPLLLELSSGALLILSMVSWFGVQIGLLFILSMILYFYLDLKIFKRTKELEETLPYFLQIVSANLKGGMSFENALFGAIKPRFKILANEMSEVSKKVMTGYDVTHALKEFSDKYNSPMLHRTIDLMVSELRSGGHVTSIIDRIVDSLQEMGTLKKDISASVVAYTIFIGAIVIFISPLLFALSYHLLIIIIGFVTKLSAVTTRTDSFILSVGDVDVSPGLFLNFSIAAIVIISFFSSLIVALVEKGNMRSGLKFIPIFIFGSLIMFLIFMQIMSLVFEGFTF